MSGGAAVGSEPVASGSIATAMVTTSVGDAASAKALAEALVEQRLAACVQIVPITSVYRWKDAVESAGEHLLVCKIAAADFAAVEAEILRRHAYELPEIVMSPITGGHGAYLDWITQSTTR